MPYEDDEIRRAARARLQQRMQQRGTPPDAERPSSDYPQQQQRRAQQQGRRPQPQGRRQQQQRPPQQQRQRSTSKPPRKPGGVPALLPARIPRRVVIAIAGIAALLIVAFAVRCSISAPENSGAPASSSASASASSAAASTEASNASASTESQSAASTIPAGQISTQISGAGEDMRNELVELMGEENADKLLAEASTDTQALWIAAHPQEYEFDGIETQVKILKLAANEPKSLPYVRSYPSQYPSAEPSTDESIAMPADSPSPNVPNTNVPHFYQWDRRWGNIVYSSAAFGLTGCGPTSLAMVYQGLTGKTDLNPYGMAALAESRGYMSEFNGTDNAIFGGIAGELGLNYEELYPSAENMTSALKSGHVIIARLGPGIFTTRGHFFVLAGLADNGEVIINDPYSYERSSVTWPAETIAQEATILYSYSKA